MRRCFGPKTQQYKHCIQLIPITYYANCRSVRNYPHSNGDDPATFGVAFLNSTLGAAVVSFNMEVQSGNEGNWKHDV